MCYIEDFNVIISQDYKVGGCEVRFSEAEGFENFIRSCALLELAWKGASFTWFNKHFGDYDIQQCLDLV